MTEQLPNLDIFHRGYRTVVHEEHRDEQWQPRPEIIEQIERVWNKRPPADSWNSTKIRLEGSRVQGNTHYVRTALTDYKHHVGSRYQPNPEDRAMLLGVGAIIITSDGYYVFGERNNDHKYNLISGGVDPKEDFLSDGEGRKVLSFEHALRREIHEEIGVITEDIKSLQHEMLCSAAGDGAPNLVYHVQLAIPCTILNQRVASAIAVANGKGEEPEIIAAHYVRCSGGALSREIEQHTKYTKVGAGIVDYLFRRP